ncbi:hypothetical protein LPJGGPFB_00273 [Ensifer adhaerens]|nr:hypothetical protein [Ensifer adhaerens]
MDKLVLYVGNKNYSSWSLRPWLALEAAGITFEDVVIPFDFCRGKSEAAGNLADWSRTASHPR